MRKATAVQILHDKLEADLLRWRQHVLHRQMEMSKEVETRFTQNLLTKSLNAQEKLKKSQDHHKQLFNQ